MDMPKKPKPRYHAVWWFKSNGPATNGPIEYSADLAASHIPKNVHGATVLRDDQGAYHPANAGKFFLHRIIK